MMRSKQTKAAITWARKRLPKLEEEYGIRRSAVNALLTEAERKFNFGCARAIERMLKIQRDPETEEEVEAWEKGDDDDK